MKHPVLRLAGLVLAAGLPVASAHAQLDSLLGKGGQGNDLKGMAGLGNAPLTSGSMGNVAGLLQYCIGNNYLGGDSAASVKDQLMGKLSGDNKTQNPDYSDGQKGLLHGSDGKLMSLGGGGLKAELTKKACDAILTQAKSFL